MTWIMLWLSMLTFPPVYREEVRAARRELRRGVLIELDCRVQQAPDGHVRVAQAQCPDVPSQHHKE